MKRLNSYYLISIITLVLMAFIFMRMLQVNQWFEYNNSPSYRLIADHKGNYRQLNPSADSSWNVDHTPGPGPGQWISLGESGGERFRILLNDFEDDQVLMEIFQGDSLSGWSRLDGCELLTEVDDSGQTLAFTTGAQCGLAIDPGRYITLKITLGKTSIRVHIDRYAAASDSLLSNETFTFEKEMSK